MNSLWLKNIAESPKYEFPELQEDLEADICIIGAGIFGISTAYYLSQKGYNVTILERDRISNKVTGHTTAKITSQHGLIYHYLLNQYGKDFAKKYYEANQEAIGEIHNLIKKYDIKCDFENQTNYIYTTNYSEVLKINEEREALKKLKIDYEVTEDLKLPFKIEKAIGFKNQAQFNPIKYINGLLEEILKSGVKIYENTTCYDIKKDDDKYICFTKNNKVKSKYVVIATHYPFINIPGIYFAKMYQSSSYVIGVDTKTDLFEGMYINIQPPTYSFRTAIDGDKKILLLGGADHKTGQDVDFKQSYGLLEEKVKKWYPNAEVKYAWSTRDCITLDKIIYIGEFSNLMPNVYVGTGFNKWGMTSSNVASRIITDLITKKENKYEEIFKATRVNPIVNKDEVKNMISQTVKSIVVDRIINEDSIEIKELKQDEAKIFEYKGKKIGIYKSLEGKIYAVRPICTHLGCVLSWNSADKTWDCPCHGSRFDFKGKNLYNPALKDLELVNLNEL